MRRVLVVDDDPVDSRLLDCVLSMAGYDVRAVGSACEAFVALRREAHDAIILDVILPGMNGLDLCRRIRTISAVPIIFLSARDGVKDKVRGLEVGADDYLAKPFDADELLARVASILRRRVRRIDGADDVAFPELIFDPADHTVTLSSRGATVCLTPIEARLLHALMREPGCCLTHEAIGKLVWGRGYDGTSNQVDVYVSRLRRKIEEHPDHPRRVLTIHGFGYAYQPGEAVAASSAVAS